MIEDLIIPVKKISNKKTKLEDDSFLADLVCPKQEEISDKKEPDIKSSPEVCPEEKINISKLVFNYELNPVERKMLKELIEYLESDTEIHSVHFYSYCNNLPASVLHSEEIQALVKNKITKTLLSSGYIGVVKEYVDTFGIDPEYFAAKKFDSFRKKMWSEKIESGTNINFSTGKEQEFLFSSKISEEENKIDSLLNGEYGSAKNLFSQKELLSLGLAGAISIATSKNWRTTNIKGEEIINFNSYKKEFSLDDKDIGKALIEEIKKNILNYNIHKELSDKYPEIGNFLGTPEARGLVLKAITKGMILGHDLEDYLKKFNIKKEELNQDEIIKKFAENISEGKISFSYSLENFLDYIDEDNLDKFKQALLLMKKDLKNDFLERYFSKVTEYRGHKEKRDQQLERFKNLNLPKEWLVDFGQNVIIHNIENGNFYKNHNEETLKPQLEFFGVGEGEKQEAQCIGYFKYQIAKNYASGLVDINSYVGKEIGLEEFKITPKIRQIIKEQYLKSIKKGDYRVLDGIDKLLDKNNEKILWSVEEHVALIEAVSEGVINICLEGREKIKSFLDNYYPERHKIFLLNNPKFKQDIQGKIIQSIECINSKYIEREKFNEAISYFNLDEKEITSKANDLFKFVDSSKSAHIQKILPNFNVKEHNDNWISEQDPQTIIDFAINRKEIGLLGELAVHQNTKELFTQELAEYEKLIIDGGATDAELISALWLLKNSFKQSSLVSGLEEKEKQNMIFNLKDKNAALVLKRMSRLTPDERKESALLKLSSRNSEKIFYFIEDLLIASEIGVLNPNLERRLQDDFGIDVKKFQERGKINTEIILTELEKSIQENVDNNLLVNEEAISKRYTGTNTILLFRELEISVLSGKIELKNEELFLKIFRKYIIDEEKSDDYRVDQNSNFYDSIARLINDKKSLNDNNLFSQEAWAEALVAYVILMEEENRGDQRQKTRKEDISSFFSGPYRDLCLEGMNGEWKKFLKDESRQEIPFKLKLISDTINYYGGAGNLSKVESFSGLIKAVKDAMENDRTADKTKFEIKSILNKEEKRFEKEKWSQDDKTEFYCLAKDIIEAAPSLFSSFSSIFENMSGKEMKRFMKELMPLYQAELITIQTVKDNDNIEYDSRDLVSMRRALKRLSSSFSVQPDKKEETIDLEKENLVVNIRARFKERFGLVSVPETLNTENFRSVHNFIRYTGNINGRDAKREALLSFYLGLELNGDWEKFRSGVKVDILKYLSADKADLIKEQLAKKEENSLPLEIINIKETESASFQTGLQAEVLSTMLGNIETIDIKLGNVKRNASELLDPDLYDDQRDKKLIAILIQNDKLVGAVLAKTFQALSGKEIKFSPEDLKLKSELALALGITDWTQNSIKEAQERIQPISLINKLVKRMEESRVDENIAELNLSLEPSEKIIKIFNTINVDFKTASGAIAISQDIETLESQLVKNAGRISPEEKEEAKKYLDVISEKKAELEKIMESTKEYFEKIKSSNQLNKNSKNFKLDSRLAELEKIIYSKGGDAMIVTEMTKDMNLIIENMRQCLGCLRKEINNDTNLAYGDYNKFFMMSRKEKNKGSIADEIVFFVPTKQEGGETEMSFVLDKIYGSKSSDILVAHIMTVYQKYKPLADNFKEAKISISVSRDAMSSVGINQETLQKILQEKMPDLKSIEFQENLTASIPESSLSDNYIEFGNGEARQSGERQFSALVIK